MSIKLKTIHEWKHGHKNIVPGLGEIKISEDGTFETDNEAGAQILVDADCGFEYVKGKPSEVEKGQKSEDLKKKAEEDELGNKGSNQDDLTPSKDDADTLIKALDSKSLADLKVLATESQFPENEWKNLSEKKLREYLKDKLTS